MSRLPRASSNRPGNKQSNRKPTNTGVKKSVLAIVAHPDDEILGCGGTLALHAQAGDHVTVVIAADGRSGEGNPDDKPQRRCAQQALEKIGVSDLRLLGFPDQRLDTFPLTEIITPIEKIVRDVRPMIVYCQHGGDINRDHEILFKAALVSTRPMESFVEALYAFDTASSTEWAYPRNFVPDTWVDISRTIEAKLEALSCYESEVRPYPHPRSLEGLRCRAEAWGTQSCIEAAEVYMTVRRVFRGGQVPG